MLEKDAIGTHIFHWVATALVLTTPLIIPRLAYGDDGAVSNFSEGALVLAGLMLVLLAYLFYLVFRWSQRNEQASYLGVVYQDTIFEFEFSRRKARVDKRLHEGEYRRQALSHDDWLQRHHDIHPPSFPEELRKYIINGGGSTTIDDELSEDRWEYFKSYSIDTKDMSEEERSLYDQYQNDERDYIKRREEWQQRLANKEEELYNEALDVARTKAEEAATRAADVDISIFRGRGPTFVLEFTAIVVIIFSAVILGILSILDANQIGTLLAAVAGYVLGRSTSRGSEGDRSTKPKGELPNNHAETPGKNQKRANE